MASKTCRWHLFLFALIIATCILCLWIVSKNNHNYDLSFYPVIVTFAGVLHIQIGCFMVINFLNYRKKSHLLPLATAFICSGVFLFIALYIYFRDKDEAIQLYNNIAILYTMRHILIAGLFIATLHSFKYNKSQKESSQILINFTFIWSVGFLILAICRSAFSILPTSNLIDPHTMEWLFLWHGALIYPLGVAWACIIVLIFKYTKFREPFWLSMALVSLSNILSLVIMVKYSKVNSLGWYLARSLECLSAMVVMVVLMSDIFRRYKASRQAYEISYENSVRDPMTRLFNRGFFYSRLTHEINFSCQERPLSLIFCDIDHFKSVNDTWGHLQGDRVIIRLAELMKSMIRENDVLARTGGEEFAIILPNTDVESAYDIAERLRKNVESLTPKTTNQEFPRKITISLGLYNSTDKNITTEQFAELADRALYMAKNNGRNCTIIYHDKPSIAEVR